MPSAGNYYRKFTWMIYTLTTDEDTNQDIESWEEGPRLWGYISANKKLKQENEFGIPKHESQVEIRIRNWVEIDARDRLVDSWFGGTYRIEGRHWGDNEVILEAVEMLNEDGTS